MNNTVVSDDRPRAGVVGEVIETVVDVDSGDDPRWHAWHPGLEEVGTVPPGGSRKYYLDPAERAGSANLVLAGGRTLTVSWDPNLLPYLGIWFDRSRFSREDVIAIEPSTGWYDSAARALAHGRVLVLPARTSASWWLELPFEDRPTR